MAKSQTPEITRLPDVVRDESNGKVVIADGYHRLCALYGFNEDIWVHCKIA